MSRRSRELRAQRVRKNRDAKRLRKVERDGRRTELNMTVINTVFVHGDPWASLQNTAAFVRGDPRTSLVNVIKFAVQQTNAALLYADKVTLVSPAVALMQSTDDAANRTGFDLLIDLAAVAPKYFPQWAAELQKAEQQIRGFPPRSQWTARQEREYETWAQVVIEGVRPIQEQIRERADKLHSDTNFDQLRLAVDAGLLTIERMAGADVPEPGDTSEIVVMGLLERIQKLFDTRNQYPLFDANAGTIVTGGLEMGIFTRTPVARRLGADASMAAGLFDHLPLFPNATTSEILDIRTELSPALGAFRTGVSKLTEDIEVAPEDPQFGEEIEYAWNSEVAPALDEIDATFKENTSMSDLLKKMITDPVGATTAGAGVVLPFSLGIAAGPAQAFITAAGVVTGTTIATVKSLIKEKDAIAEARKAQFYFLYGTDQMLGIS